MGELKDVARKLVEGGKGVFAADASPKTLEKRFADMGTEVKDAQNRLKYRLMTVAAPGLGEYIGGVILHDEAIRNEEIRRVVTGQGMMVGIKVDGGTADMPGNPMEKVTEGLEGLELRLAEYSQWGAKFCKWRAIVGIGENLPSEFCMRTNAQRLAWYAASAQKMGLVPIVEPEVLMEGDHTVQKCGEVTEVWGRMVYEELRKQGVDLEGMLYKPNMVVAGKDCPTQPSDSEVAKLTVEVMRRTVPMEVPGVCFLSGGMAAKSATARLNEIASLGSGALWKWSFSFERAIEQPAMKIWGGRDENAEVAQKALVHRAKMNSLASGGMYDPAMEKEI